MTAPTVPQEQQEQFAVPLINRDVERYLSRKAQVLPHRSNWASDLADPCLRKLVYHRTCWDKQEKPAPYLQGIFETGKKLERIVINICNDIGESGKPQWEFAAHAAPLNDAFLRAHQIGCNPDVFLKVWPREGEGLPRFLGPVDIKTMDPNTFRQINAPEDLDRKPYMRRYPAQVMIYELASNFEIGWLLLVNKTNIYDYKLLPIPMDYAYAESLIQKADAVNKHLAAKTLPEQLNRTEDCQRCPYKAYCCPSCSTGGNLSLLDNDALAEVLMELSELDEAKSNIAYFEKQRDKLLEEHKGKDIICGEFIIKWTWQEPQSTPPKPRAGFWKKEINRICAEE